MLGAASAESCPAMPLRLGTIPTGLHFGTIYRDDVMPADPTTWEPTFWDQLADPKELIAIWVADCWFMNLDREVYGNLLLDPGPRGKWHLITADQSDCFLGAGAFADQSCFSRSRQHGPAPHLTFLERTVLAFGVSPIEKMVRRIQQAASSVSQVVARVPEAWWRQAGVSPKDVIDCLTERGNRIRAIVQMDYWEGLSRATRGGQLL
jgi:hypothetical protein